MEPLFMSNKPSIAFERLSASNWHVYKCAVLDSEQMFDESLRTEEEEYAQMIADPHTISLVMLIDGQYAGSAITKSLKPEDRGELHLNDLPEDPSAIYLHNFVIETHHQGQGLGLALMKQLVEMLKKEARFTKLTGHFRPNGSLATILKLGGKLIKEEQNWFGTGETFSYCELEIK